MRIENGHLVGIAILRTTNQEEAERLELMMPMPTEVLNHYGVLEGSGELIYNEVAIPMAQTPVVENGFKNHVRVILDYDNEYIMVGSVGEFLEALDKY